MASVLDVPAKSLTDLEKLKAWVETSEPGMFYLFTDDMVQQLNSEGEATSTDFNEYIQGQHGKTVEWHLSGDGRDYHFKRIRTPEQTLYEDGPDARQGDAATITSRFRPRYRKLDDAELKLHDEIKSAATVLESLFERIPPGREVSLGITNLEQAVMWAVKGLTK